MRRRSELFYRLLIGQATGDGGSGDATTLAGKTVPAPTATDDEKVLAYDNDINSFKFITPSGGTGTGGAGVTEYNSLYTATGGEANIPIGIAEYDSTKDVLEVYQSGIRIFKSDSFALNANNTSIDLQGYTAEANEKFHFVCLKPNESGGGEGGLAFYTMSNVLKHDLNVIPITIYNTTVSSVI